MENSGFIGQIPQIVEALLARLEGALTDIHNPERLKATETLIANLRKQTANMRAIIDAAGEGLTPEQTKLLSQLLPESFPNK